MTLGRTLISLLLLLSTAPAVAAQLYRWVDAEGRVHFGDRPPSSVQAKAIGDALPPINSADASTPAKPSRQLPAQLQRQYQKQQRRQQQQFQRQQARACAQAQQRLSHLKGRVYFVDDKGREVRTSERQRQDRAKQLQQQINQYCRS